MGQVVHLYAWFDLNGVFVVLLQFYLKSINVFGGGGGVEGIGIWSAINITLNVNVFD